MLDFCWFINVHMIFGKIDNASKVLPFYEAISEVILNDHGRLF